MCLCMLVLVLPLGDPQFVLWQDQHQYILLLPEVEDLRSGSREIPQNKVIFMFVVLPWLSYELGIWLVY
jgi:hypothetical protein